MTPFKSVPEGYQSHWEDTERIVVAALTLEIADLLRQQTGATEPTGADSIAALYAAFDEPTEIHDPAVQRLLPDATDDVELAAEFRRLTQNDLAMSKIQALRRWAKLLTADQRNIDHGLVIVPRGQARAVAAALTDIRLVLAQRLGLETDDDVERLHAALFDGGLADDIRNYWASVFVTVGYAQQSLVDEMIRDLRASGRPAATWD